MKWTRNKYHYAVKKLKRATKKLNSEALHSAAMSGNQALFDEMKKYLNAGKSGQTVPDTLEGKVSHEDILDKFRECYSKLYNQDQEGMEENMINVKAKIDSLIRNNIMSSQFEVDKITPEIVKSAANTMKSGKTDVSGSFTSDVFQNSPDIVFEHLALVFKSFLTHGTMSKEILACAFMPMFKGGLKNPAKFDSYRAIAGASQVLKLLEYVILLIWGDKMTSDSLQFGFKKKVSTTQCSWLVMEIANYMVRRGVQVSACFLDFSKAFDMVLFNKMFEKMIDKDIPAVVVRVLVYAYEEQKGWVRLAGKNSETFRLTNGTRQGSVLSPFFFAGIYLNDLLQKLRKMGLGCHIAGFWMGALGFADDVVLLTTNRQELQRMLTVCEEYGREHNLVFSTDPNPVKSKTKCVQFGHTSRCQYPDPVFLDGKALPWVERVEHLGHILHESLSMNADCTRARASFMDRASDL